MVSELVLPVGVHMEDAPSPSLYEGYEVQWRDDDEPTHYFFHAQVSVLRLERLLPDALASLPPLCQAVLEVRRTDDEMDADPAGPEVRRFVSELVPRRELLEVLRRYRFPILHDGMMGFGGFDPDSAFEVFLDDHKLLSLFAPTMEPFERLLSRHRVPHRRELRTVLDLDHEHHALRSVPDRCRVPRASMLRRQRLDVAWVSRAIQRRLGMQPEQRPEADES